MFRVNLLKKFPKINPNKNKVEFRVYEIYFR